MARECNFEYAERALQVEDSCRRLELDLEVVSSKLGNSNTWLRSVKEDLKKYDGYYFQLNPITKTMKVRLAWSQGRIDELDANLKSFNNEIVHLSPRVAVLLRFVTRIGGPNTTSRCGHYRGFCQLTLRQTPSPLDLNSFFLLFCMLFLQCIVLGLIGLRLVICLTCQSTIIDLFASQNFA